MEKQCSRCNLIQESSNFYFDKYTKDNLMRNCKVCYKEKRKMYYLKNIERERARKRKDAVKYKQQKAEYDIIYRLENKKKIAKYKKDWEFKRRHEPEFKLLRNIRRRINHALVDNYKSDHTMVLLGCTIEFFKQYLESLFQDGMSWENYGPNTWHIDHIIPCREFDLSDPEQQKKCFHYTNQRPLWAKDNLSRPKNIQDW